MKEEANEEILEKSSKKVLQDTFRLALHYIILNCTPKMNSKLEKFAMISAPKQEHIRTPECSIITIYRKSHKCHGSPQESHATVSINHVNANNHISTFTKRILDLDLFCQMNLVPNLINVETK